MAQIFPNDSHSTVVHKIAGLIEKNNPGIYRLQFSTGGYVVSSSEPDIILFNKETGSSVMVIQVETIETLSRPEVPTRWLGVSRIAPKLQIVIPKGTVNRVKRQLKKTGLKASIVEY